MTKQRIPTSKIFQQNFNKETLSDYNYNDRIDFDIVYTNKENEEADYNEPNFYTDCSNPITLGYLNRDILTNYSVSDDSKTVSFNGKVLKEANINLDDISKIDGAFTFGTDDMDPDDIENVDGPKIAGAAIPLGSIFSGIFGGAPVSDDFQAAFIV